MSNQPAGAGKALVAADAGLSPEAEAAAHAGAVAVPADPSDPFDAAAEPASPGGPLDANGHDPAFYQWLPVLRKPRKDGWTPQRQADFISWLADTGCVAVAAREAGMSENSSYRLRRTSPQFAAAWEAAIGHASRRLVDIAFDRAIHGSDEPVFNKDGDKVGRRMRQNDRLLMFLLRAYMPERFRNAHRDMASAPDARLPPAAAPIAEALMRLEPVQPADPHLLMPPEELDVALQVADICDGDLPHWHRGRPDNEPYYEISLGPAFELALEEAKRGGSPARRAGETGGEAGGEEGAEEDWEEDGYERGYEDGEEEEEEGFWG